MNRVVILVSIGGSLGSTLRYLIATYFTKIFPSSFPYGTFIVNVSGCLLIGIFYGLSERFDWVTPELRIFLTTGLVGGYTTFSSFIYENINLLQTAQYLTFALYSITSYVFGLIGAFAGFSLTKIFTA